MANNYGNICLWILIIIIIVAIVWWFTQQSSKPVEGMEYLTYQSLSKWGCCQVTYPGWPPQYYLTPKFACQPEMFGGEAQKTKFIEGVSEFDCRSKTYFGGYFDEEEYRDPLIYKC